MFSTLAVLVYLVAFGVPVLLIWRFHPQAWYWHAVALLGALGMGFFEAPEKWHTATFDILFGAVFICLLVWGIGGLVAFRRHRERHV
jgi:hypothetical protein